MAFTKIVSPGIDTTGSYTVRDLNAVGVVTASSFSGPLIGDATGLTGTPDVTVGAITAASADFSGNVSIAGTLTYEDVTNIDSVGIITAQAGIRVTGGSLGIGTATPSTPLEIYSDPSSAWKFRINTSVSDGAGFYQRENGDFEVVLRDASNNNNYIAGTSGALQFAASGSEKLRIASDGDVGIGTNNPGSRLDVRNASGTNPLLSLHHSNADVEGEVIRVGRTDIPAIRYHSIKAQHGGAATANYITFNLHDGSSITSQSEILRLRGDGNVGIGTDNPTSALEIRTTITNAATHYRNNASNGGAYFGVRATDLGVASAGEAYIYSYNSGINLLADGTGDINFATGGTASRLRIASDGAITVTSDGSDDDGANITLKHANNNTTDTVSALIFSNNTGEVARIVGRTDGANNNGGITFHTDNAGTTGERLRITSDGKIGVNRSQPQGILHVYTDTLNADNGYNGQNFGIVVETEDSNNDGDEGNGICFTQQYSTDALDSGKVRTGAIIGYKDQATGNFGGGLKFKVQQFGATPLLTSMMLDKSGNVGIGTESIGDKLVVHQGTDDDIIVRVNGADSTTEFAGLGVGSGYASVVAGGSQTTNTDLVFMTANNGVEAGRWRINKDGILYNMEGGYTYSFKRYQGTVPNMTAGNWYTVANTTTIADAGLWILTFGRFEQSQTGSSQWSVTYVGGPVYLHSANGNDGDVVTVPLYHMGHAQNGSGASCRLTYRTGGTAHSSGRVQFKPDGWSYTGTNAYYKFYKIADL